RRRWGGEKRVVVMALPTGGARPAGSARRRRAASTRRRSASSEASRALKSGVAAVTVKALDRPHRLQDLLGVAVDLHPREHLAHDAFPVDHDSGGARARA